MHNVLSFRRHSWNKKRISRITRLEATRMGKVIWKIVRRHENRLLIEDFVNGLALFAMLIAMMHLPF